MFYYILKKEFRLIFRDIHALLVLFLMPAAFILIMSLALKNSYSNTLEVPLKVALTAPETPEINLFLKELSHNAYFEVTLVSKSSLKKLLFEEKYDFALHLDENYKEKINKNDKTFTIQIYSKPDTNKEYLSILKHSIVEVISKNIMKDYFIASKKDASLLGKLDSTVVNTYVYKNNKQETTPTSVQQSVPAWLIFSMFFILIPISNTFVNEKNFGTLARIRSINVSVFPLLTGKILPYFIINQIQVVLMLLMGIFLVPLVGGDALIIQGNYFLIFFVTSCVSIAAICFALFIANISKTTEEATSIGGVINIIFAALGGIMVPKFIMPEFMQQISAYSPMSWGLESLLELFVRGGNFSDISVYLLYLLLFAAVFLLLSYILLKKGRN
ncbi:MAG: ABC transporter permease [Arcobacteraceae bacterium]